MPATIASGAAAPCILLFGARARARATARALLPRRRGLLLAAKNAEEFAAAFRDGLIDAALVDLAVATEDAWRAAALAREFPSIPFFGLLPLRATDAPTVAQCAALDFTDVLIDGIDEPPAAGFLVAPHFFSARFADALREPPAALRLARPLQLAAWMNIVGAAGRAVRTGALATTLGVTREHLSRAFAAGDGPNLKRVIDLVRLLAAAELAKNPGYDVRDVAHILGFASSSHLSSTAHRLVGTRPASLARLRTVDLIERFSQGRGRSRK